MKIFRLLMKILAIVLLVFTLVTSRILPLQYIVGIGVIEILLLLLVWKHKVIQIFIVILMVITSFGIIYVESIANRVINYNPNEVNTISFFVLKESSVRNLKDMIKKSSNIAVSTLIDEEVVSFAKSQLTVGGYTKSLKVYTGIKDGLTNLYEGKTDVLMIDQGYLTTVQDYDAQFLAKTKVVLVFKKSDAVINLKSKSNIAKQPFVVYISGVDNRAEFQNNRSDTNMLAVVNPITNIITLVSVPRDAYVPIVLKNATPLDKLTHAGVYGIDCSIKTMALLLDVDVNYYIRAHFETVTKLVDALGTIDVYLEEGFTINEKVYTPGLNKLNGEYALLAARWRRTFATGDQQRIKNQQEVLKGIVNKLLEPSSLTKIESIISAIQGTVDTNLSGNDIFALVRKQIQNRRGWTFKQVYVTGKDAYAPSYAMGGQILNVIALDKIELATAKKAIKDALKVE